MKIKTIPCPRCLGTGETMDHVWIGSKMKSFRLRLGLSLRQLAKEMKISAPYLSDLERGRRNWNHELIDAYETSLNKIKALW